MSTLRAQTVNQIAQDANNIYNTVNSLKQSYDKAQLIKIQTIASQESDKAYQEALASGGQNNPQGVADAYRKCLANVQSRASEIGGSAYKMWQDNYEQEYKSKINKAITVADYQVKGLEVQTALNSLIDITASDTSKSWTDVESSIKNLYSDLNIESLPPEAGKFATKEEVLQGIKTQVATNRVYTAWDNLKDSESYSAMEIVDKALADIPFEGVEKLDVRNSLLAKLQQFDTNLAQEANKRYTAIATNYYLECSNNNVAPNNNDLWSRVAQEATYTDDNGTHIKHSWNGAVDGLTSKIAEESQYIPSEGFGERINSVAGGVIEAVGTGTFDFGTTENTENTFSNSLLNSDGTIKYDNFSTGKGVVYFTGADKQKHETPYDSLYFALEKELQPKNEAEKAEIVDYINSEANKGTFFPPDKKMIMDELLLLATDPNANPDDVEFLAISYVDDKVFTFKEMNTLGLLSGEKSISSNGSFKSIVKSATDLIETKIPDAKKNDELGALNRKTVLENIENDVRKEYLGRYYSMLSQGVAPEEIVKTLGLAEEEIVTKYTEGFVDKTINKLLEEPKSFNDFVNNTSVQVVMNDIATGGDTYSQYFDPEMVLAIEGLSVADVPLSQLYDKLSQKVYGGETKFAELDLGQQKSLITNYVVSKYKEDMLRLVNDTFGYSKGDLRPIMVTGYGYGYLDVANNTIYYADSDSKTKNTFMISHFRDNGAYVDMKNTRVTSLRELTTPKLFNSNGYHFGKNTKADLSDVTEDRSVINEYTGETEQDREIGNRNLKASELRIVRGF